MSAGRRLFLRPSGPENIHHEGLCCLTELLHCMHVTKHECTSDHKLLTWWDISLAWRKAALIIRNLSMCAYINDSTPLSFILSRDTPSLEWLLVTYHRAASQVTLGCLKLRHSQIFACEHYSVRAKAHGSGLKPRPPSPILHINELCQTLTITAA